MSKAKIYWLPTELGGRTKPPAQRYAGVAEFTVPYHPSAGYWSLLVENDQEPKLGETTTAKVQFLCEDAPRHYLEPGNQFVMHEGRRVIGIGITL